MHSYNLRNLGFTKFDLSSLRSLQTNKGFRLFQLLEQERAGRSPFIVRINANDLIQRCLNQEFKEEDTDKNITPTNVDELVEKVIIPAIKDICEHTSHKYKFQEIAGANRELLIFFYEDK